MIGTTAITAKTKKKTNVLPESTTTRRVRTERIQDSLGNFKISQISRSRDTAEMTRTEKCGRIIQEKEHRRRRIIE